MYSDDERTLAWANAGYFQTALVASVRKLAAALREVGHPELIDRSTQDALDTCDRLDRYVAEKKALREGALAKLTDAEKRELMLIGAGAAVED